MLVTLFDNVGLVHHNFVPVWQTVNYAFHIDVPKCLTDAIQWKSWKNEWTFGFCTIAMCLVTHPSQYSTSSWEPNSSHPTATDLSRPFSLWHLLLPKPQDFFVHRQNSTEIDSRSHSHSNTGNRVIFSKERTTWACVYVHKGSMSWVNMLGFTYILFTIWILGSF